jgi:hypothetical protein
MNERIRELAKQAGIVFWEISGDADFVDEQIKKHFGVEE